MGLRLGQERKTSHRPMALQYAVTEVLRQAPDLEPFPGRRVLLPADRFSALAASIADTANQPGWATSPGFTWTPAFSEGEAGRSLQQRGYAPQPTAIPEPTPIIQIPPSPADAATRRVTVSVPETPPAAITAAPLPPPEAAAPLPGVVPKPTGKTGWLVAAFLAIILAAKQLA